MKNVLLVFMLLFSLRISAQVSDSLTVRNFYLYAKEIGIKYPEYVVAQAVLESGWLKDPHAVRKNNFVGMKNPKGRVTTAINTSNNPNEYATYKTWKDCLNDYHIWQTRYASKYVSLKDYIGYIDRIYSVTGNYVEMVNKIYNSSHYRKQIGYYE